MQGDSLAASGGAQGLNLGLGNNQGLPKTGVQSIKARFDDLPKANKLGIAIGLPLILAIGFAMILWATSTSYKVLFNGLSDQDGGEIVAALTNMKIPYKYSSSGTSILVPEDKVYDARLALASQGLPKGSTKGMEVMDSQALGVTQFQEQVNYQRGLEGELAKSIQSLDAVESARVHLAMPKPSIFVRDEEKPSASVVVSLYRGKSLTQSQIDGIVHLVSSSLPNLNPKAVSIVDQSGALLTKNDEDGVNGATTSQMSLQEKRERSYEQSIVEILTPLFGRENVRATVSTDMNFNATERTKELYTPNNQETAAIRSKQSSSTVDGDVRNPSGIPGILANTPPDGALAQIGGNPRDLTPPSPNKDVAVRQSDEVVNYEVDREVVQTKEQVGTVNRLTAGVVINYKTITDGAGAVREVPLTPPELAEISALVKKAIGFNESRGDELNIVNQPFNRAVEADVGFWNQPQTLDTLKSIGMPLAVAMVIGFLIFGLLRPLLKPLMANDAKDGPDLLPNTAGNVPLLASAGGDSEDDEFYVSKVDKESLRLEKEREERLEMVRTLAKENPEILASVVKNWIGGVPMAKSVSMNTPTNGAA